MSSMPLTPGGPSKIAIPRLPQKRKEPPHKGNSKQDRITRACLSCRARKIKCNGATPKCSHCRENTAPCEYVSSRRDRLKTATSQNQDMIVLLQDLRTQASDSNQSRIDILLATVIDDVADAVATVQKSVEQADHVDREEERGEANVSAEVGSSTDLDLIDEDILRNEQTRATGFIGKASEIQWLRKLHTDGGNNKFDGPYGPPGLSSEAATERLTALRRRQEMNPSPLMHTSKASFYLDDDVLETDFMVDPFELPQFEVAEKLLQVYMDHCHDFFPFLSKKSFVSQFYQYYAALRRGTPYESPQKWQATLNLVFAIGAVYSHLISAEWCQDERDHLVYYSRATALGLKDPFWFSHPDLPQMQITGLLSFYFLSVGRVNRAWVLIGLAMRFGYALGLHMRNEDRGSGVAKREVLSRIWWAHFSFERLLSAIIGRPSLGVDKNCSVPLPLPVSSEDIEGSIIESRFGDQPRMPSNRLHQRPPTASSQSPESSTRSETYGAILDPANSGSYLKNVVQLFEITQEALHLYDAGTVTKSWESTQKTIALLLEKLELWATILPEGFSILNSRPQAAHRYQREQSTLNLLYHNTKILMTRPCLCRLDRRIKNQSARSDDFNRQAAVACVASAKMIANHLPDDSEGNILALYELGPWWSMVHTVMQSLTVLLLEVSIQPANFPQDQSDIIPSLKKLVRWLRVMRSSNGVAKRAYSIILNLLKFIVTTISIDISDLLHEENEASTTATTSAATPTPFYKVHATHTYASHINDPAPRREAIGHSSRGSAQIQINQQHGRYDGHGFDSSLHFSQDTAFYETQAGPSAAGPTDPFVDPWTTSGLTTPGLFFTNFDEQNPLPDFGEGFMEEFDPSS